MLEEERQISMIIAINNKGVISTVGYVCDMLFPINLNRTRHHQL